jgi:2-methylisocitrate lyase-like PEP mutase family enzyme
MNLEDATGDPRKPLLDLALQVERVKAVQEAARKLVVLNARTDVYLLQLETPETRYDAALRRLAAYRDAGADCVFVPGLQDAETIKRLVKDLQCPINILGGPGARRFRSWKESAWRGLLWGRARCRRHWDWYGGLPE